MGGRRGSGVVSAILIAGPVGWVAFSTQVDDERFPVICRPGLAKGGQSAAPGLDDDASARREVEHT